MNKSLLFWWLLALLPVGGSGQVSFGVKVGGTVDPIFLSNHFIRPWDNGFADTHLRIQHSRSNFGAEQLRSSNSELRDTLIFGRDNKNSINPINIEFGAYLSLPINTKGRIRIELVYHDFHLRYGTTGYAHFSELNDLIDNANSYLLVDRVEGRFIRPSLHYQYYFTPNIALNLGLSYSLAMNNEIQRGSGSVFVYFFDDPSPYSGDEILYEVVSSIDKLPNLKSAGMLGLNAGFLFRLWGLPKMEIRGAYYFGDWLWKNNDDTNEIETPWFSQPIRYIFHQENISYQTLSLFLEL